MNYDGIKLIYSEGKPQWLMPDGSFVPVQRGRDGSIVPSRLYLRDRVLDGTRPIYR